MDLRKRKCEGIVAKERGRESGVRDSLQRLRVETDALRL